MKISDIMKERTTFSFEVFPPKLDKPIEPLLGVLKKLYGFRPDYISCTYGAGGTNKGRNLEICSHIVADGQTLPLAHTTCIAASKHDIRALADEYISKGVKNFLALRGDYPAGWSGTRGDFQHGTEMVRFLRENFPDLCIGAACYPEKHLYASDIDDDIYHMREKQECGADFFTTQLCYSVENFLRFIDKVRTAGITAPISVGVMPVILRDSTLRMTLSNGCSIPKELSALIGRYGDSPEDFRRAGIDYTVKLLHSYLESGISGLHIYTMNKFSDVAEIIRLSGLREYCDQEDTNG